MTSQEAQALQFPADYHRTCKCAWVRRGETVGVHLDAEHGKAFYSQLFTCGSVWSCPVCAAKVQERRREEIAAGMQWAYGKGLQCIMVTLTFPHRSWQKLSDLIEQQADALHRLRAGKPWQKVRASVGYQGLIRSLEVTHGGNGWHPHTHEVWFVKDDADIEELSKKVRRRWLMSCIRAGLVDPTNGRQVRDFLRHAVDIKERVSCSDYLAKMDDARHWGVDRELAKGSTKAGKKSGLHPFGLLEIAGKFREGDSAKAAELFREYSMTMRGKRQIFWSHGLKDQVGINDKTDEELAEEQRAEALELGQIPRDDWDLVLEYEARAEVLERAEVGGWPAVQRLLDRLVLLEIERLERLLEESPAGTDEAHPDDHPCGASFAAQKFNPGYGAAPHVPVSPRKVPHGIRRKATSAPQVNTG